MGCWNYQIYCDDTALDALDELVDSENLAEDIERMLDDELACADEYLDFDICQYGISAAGLVAISVGNADISLLTDVIFGEDSEYTALINKVKKMDLSILREKAVKAFKLAQKEDSELRELWEENEEYYPKWLNNLEQLIQTLM